MTENSYAIGGFQLNKCPVCKNVGMLHKSRRNGSWQSHILPLLLLREYYCGSCGNGFYGPAFKHKGIFAPEPTTIEEDLSSAFLAPEDDRDFQQLINEIREAEKKMGLLP